MDPLKWGVPPSWNRKGISNTKLTRPYTGPEIPGVHEDTRPSKPLVTPPPTQKRSPVVETNSGTLHSERFVTERVQSGYEMHSVLDSKTLTFQSTRVNKMCFRQKSSNLCQTTLFSMTKEIKGTRDLHLYWLLNVSNITTKRPRKRNFRKETENDGKGSYRNFWL